MDHSVEQVIQRLLYTGHRDFQLSADEILLLSTIPPEVAAPILREIYVREENEHISERAYKAFLAIHGVDKVQFLIDILEQEPSDRHISPCMDLQSFRDPRAVAALCQVIRQHPDPDIRYFAAESLSVIGDERAFPALEYMRDHDTDKDYEDVPLADTAQWALDRIQTRLRDRQQRIADWATILPGLIPATGGTLFVRAERNLPLLDYLASVSATPLPVDWTTATILVAGAQIDLTRQSYAPGNAMARRTLAIVDALTGAEGQPLRKEALVEAVLSADAAIDLVCQPDLAPADPRYAVLWQLLTIADGVVFHGATLFDATLETLGG